MSDASPRPPDHDAAPRFRRRRRRSPAWARLWTAVITVNVIGFVVATWVSRLIRLVPDSAGTETALLFGYYVAMAVAAFVDALLLDELVFKGAFRKTHLQGLGARLGRRELDVEEAAVTLQRSTVSFPLLLLVCGVVTYFAFNLINRDFDTYYRGVGQHISKLHHGDPTEQAAAARELAIRRHPRILPALLKHLERGGEAAVWSAWALGRFTDLPSRRPLIEPLVQASQSSDPALRREALISLARIQHRPMAPAIVQEIEADLQAGEAPEPRLLFALGSLQVMSSVPLLEDLLHRGDPATQKLAAWTLAQHRDQRGGRAVVEILEERLPTASLEVQCGIVHSLGILADERSNLTLMRFLDQTSAQQRAHSCSRLQLSLRPDGALDDRIDLFVPQERLDMKVIRVMGQMRASAPEIRAQVEPWLEQLSTSQNIGPEAQQAALGLLQGIAAARDDTDAPSVDEALGF